MTVDNELINWSKGWACLGVGRRTGTLLFDYIMFKRLRTYSVQRWQFLTPHLRQVLNHIDQSLAVLCLNFSSPEKIKNMWKRWFFKDFWSLPPLNTGVYLSDRPLNGSRGIRSQTPIPILRPVVLLKIYAPIPPFLGLVKNNGNLKTRVHGGVGVYLFSDSISLSPSFNLLFSSPISFTCSCRAACSPLRLLHLTISSLFWWGKNVYSLRLDCIICNKFVISSPQTH